MFCPQCKTEYREGFTTCSDCGVPLVSELPAEPESHYVDYVEVLDTYNPGDIAVIKSLLDSEGITYYFLGDHLTLRPMGDAARLMVAREDAQSARELLANLDLSYSEPSAFKEETEEPEEPEDDE
jgi:Putative prokaryotic signal transducing protein